MSELLYLPLPARRGEAEVPWCEPALLDPLAVSDCRTERWQRPAGRSDIRPPRRTLPPAVTLPGTAFRPRRAGWPGRSRPVASPRIVVSDIDMGSGRARFAGIRRASAGLFSRNQIFGIVRPHGRWDLHHAGRSPGRETTGRFRTPLPGSRAVCCRRRQRAPAAVPGSCCCAELDPAMIRTSR
jgi:hypothetical protein